MTYTLTELLKDYKNNKIQLVDESAQQARLNICATCEHRNKLGICNKCGCVLSQKVRHLKSDCPVGKW